LAGLVYLDSSGVACISNVGAQACVTDWLTLCRAGAPGDPMRQREVLGTEKALAVRANSAFERAKAHAAFFTHERNYLFDGHVDDQTASSSDGLQLPR